MLLARFVARLTLICVLACLLLTTLTTLLGKNHHGAEIAYISYEPYYASSGAQASQIRLIDVEKRLDILLAESSSTLLWSPDGERLVFSCFYIDNFSSELCALDMSTNEIRRLTQTTPHEGPLLWLPNTEQILYTFSERSLDGTIIQTLDLTTGETAPFSFHSPSSLVLSWSPDGRFVIFTEPILGAGYGIYIWDTTLDQLYIELPPQLYGANSLAWSPDSRQLVFTSTDTHSNTFQIFTAAIDDYTPRQISTGGVFNTNPAWSPDGRFVVYMQSVSGCCLDGDLMLIDLETGEQSLLVHHGAASANPVWRP